MISTTLQAYVDALTLAGEHGLLDPVRLINISLISDDWALGGTCTTVGLVRALEIVGWPMVHPMAGYGLNSQ